MLDLIPPLHLQDHRLDNGLRVVLDPDPGLPLVAVNLWYHVGSRHERPGRTGLAHLFEHMLFQGSQNVGTNEHFRQVQQIGGVANGSTWYDRTNYFETLPASHLELGLWLESDRMGFLLPAMSAAKLETQRAVVMNERRQRVDNQPYGRAFERLHELLYPDAHPYRWPVIGYMEDIAAATLEEVEAFFRRFYTPRNAVLTLSGDFDPPAALDAINRYFGPLAAGPDPPPPPDLPASNGVATRDELSDDVRLERLYLGFRVPGCTDPEWCAGDLLSTVLAGGRSSPMYRDLVYERQIAQDVSVFVLPTELESTFGVVATAKPGTPLAGLKDAVWEHLRRARDELPPVEDLERARNRLLTGYLESFQHLDQRADLLSQFSTYFEGPERLEVEIRRYLETGPDDLRGFARHHLSPQDSATVTVVPGKGSR